MFFSLFLPLPLPLPLPRTVSWCGDGMVLNKPLSSMKHRTDRFKTLLHLAATSGSTSLLSLLDPPPEDVLALDSDGCTPLHHAAASSKYDVVKFLASRANGRVRRQ